MANKSKEAFLFSVQRLHDETGELYFWTLTFREVPESDEWALNQWKIACQNAKRDFNGIHGLRVIELHKLHGLHFHLLLNRRFPIERMMRIFWPHGFGMMRVEQANPASGLYLAKYLTKKARAGDQYMTGRRRRWGAFGGFKAVRVKDVEIDCAFSRNKWLLLGMKFESQAFRAKAYWTLIGASAFGRYVDWPNTIKLRFLNTVRSSLGCEWSRILNRLHLSTSGNSAVELYELDRLYPESISKLPVDRMATPVNIGDSHGVGGSCGPSVTFSEQEIDDIINYGKKCKCPF